MKLTFLSFSAEEELASSLIKGGELTERTGFIEKVANMVINTLGLNGLGQFR